MADSKYLNIPIESLRTLIKIVETESYVKAAQEIGLSQPGVSAQMKKINHIVGENLFQKSGNRLVLTERGQAVTRFAKHILALNDQILYLGGSAAEPRALRVGICDAFVETFISALGPATQALVQIRCASSREIAESVAEGYLDVGCYFGDPAPNAHLFKKWTEALKWVQGPEFSAALGRPIPLIAAPDTVLDQEGLRCLQAHNIAYEIVFQTSDADTRLAAARTGFGVMILPSRFSCKIRSIVDADFLPAPPPVNACISFARDLTEGSIGKDLEAILSRIYLDPAM